MSVKMPSAENDVSFVKAKLRSFGTEQNVQGFFSGWNSKLHLSLHCDSLYVTRAGFHNHLILLNVIVACTFLHISEYI